MSDSILAPDVRVELRSVAERLKVIIRDTIQAQRLGLPGSLDDPAVDELMRRLFSLTGVTKKSLPRVRHVYYMQAVNGGPIKIGVAYDPEERLKQIAHHAAQPIRLLAYHVGDFQDEAALHKRFSEERLHGEWFADSPRLLAHLDRVRSIPQSRGLRQWLPG